MHIPCDKSRSGHAIASSSKVDVVPFEGTCSSCNQREGGKGSRGKKKSVPPPPSPSYSSSSSTCSSEETAGTTTTVPLFSCIYLPPTEKTSAPAGGSKYQKQPFLHSSTFAQAASPFANDSATDARVKDAASSASVRDSQLPAAKAPTAFTINHFADIVSTQKAPKRKSEASLCSSEGRNRFIQRLNSAAVAGGQPVGHRQVARLSNHAGGCKSNLICTTGSIIYALSLVILSCFFYLLDLTKKTNGLHQVFNSLVCIIGVTWLAFLHWDIQRYKLYLVNWSILQSRHSALPYNEDGELNLHPRKQSCGTTLTLVTRTSSSSDADISSSYATSRTGVRQLRSPESVAREKSPCISHPRVISPSSDEHLDRKRVICDDERIHGHERHPSLQEKWPPSQWYSFLRGSRSGSFYLKCGMAAFCFGHIIHEGLRVGHQIYYLAAAAHTSLPGSSLSVSPHLNSSSNANFNADTTLFLPPPSVNSPQNHSSSKSDSSFNNSSLISGCFDPKYLILHLIRPFFSFYQLFILFKYSNLIINKNRKLASFALMHLIATSINFWFGTIVDDAIDFYLLHHSHTGDNLQLVNEPIEASASPLKAQQGLSGGSLPEQPYSPRHLHDHLQEESTLSTEESLSPSVATKLFTNSQSNLLSEASPPPSPIPASFAPISPRSNMSNLFDVPVNLIRVDTYTRQSHSPPPLRQPFHLHLLHRKPVQITVNSHPSPSPSPSPPLFPSSVSDITQDVNGTITLHKARGTSDTAFATKITGYGEKSQVTLGHQFASQLKSPMPHPDASGPIAHDVRKKQMATNDQNQTLDLISDETITLVTDSTTTVSGPLTVTEEEEVIPDQVPMALVDVANETFASPPAASVSIASSSSLKCTGLMPMVFTSSKIFPYMYPFSIEFYLCLAFFWFILWSHIGHQSMGQESVESSFRSGAEAPFNVNKDSVAGDMSSRSPFEGHNEPVGSRRSSSGYYLPFSGHRSRSSSNGTNWSFHSSPSQTLAASTYTHEQFNCHPGKLADVIKESATSIAKPRVAALASNRIADHRSNCSSRSHKINSYAWRSSASTSDFICDSGLTSSLVISADCHSASKGLFAGFFLLIVSLVLLILFFISINSSSSESWTFASSSSVPAGVEERQFVPAFPLYIFHSQELLLNGIILLGTTYCYALFTRKLTLQSSRLNGSRLHSVHLKIDSGLLILPIPFYFFSSVLSIASELAVGPSWVRIFLLILALLAVIFQSIFIIDAFDRRLTPQLSLCNKKPAREVVTLLLITNLTAWIVYTFQFKAVETLFFTSETSYYGSTTAFVLSHATLPLMLFYKFHASVCLAEIWKNSYSPSIKEAASRRENH